MTEVQMDGNPAAEVSPVVSEETTRYLRELCRTTGVVSFDILPLDKFAGLEARVDINKKFFGEVVPAIQSEGVALPEDARVAIARLASTAGLDWAEIERQEGRAAKAKRVAQMRQEEALACLRDAADAQRKVEELLRVDYTDKILGEVAAVAASAHWEFQGICANTISFTTRENVIMKHMVHGTLLDFGIMTVTVDLSMRDIHVGRGMDSSMFEGFDGVHPFVYDSGSLCFGNMERAACAAADARDLRTIMGLVWLLLTEYSAQNVPVIRWSDFYLRTPAGKEWLKTQPQVYRPYARAWVMREAVSPDAHIYAEDDAYVGEHDAVLVDLFRRVCATTGKRYSGAYSVGPYGTNPVPLDDDAILGDEE